MTADIKDAVIRAVAELPDRNSPKDRPEMMIVSSSELSMILDEALAQPAGEGVHICRRHDNTIVANPAKGCPQCNAEKPVGEAEPTEGDLLDAFNRGESVADGLAEVAALFTTKQPAVSVDQDGMQPIDVLASIWNAMQNSADGDDLLNKLEHMRDSIGRSVNTESTSCQRVHISPEQERGLSCDASHIPSYTTPQQSQPLTASEIADIWGNTLFHITDLSTATDFVRDVEAAHGIKGVTE